VICFICSSDQKYPLISPFVEKYHREHQNAMIGFSSDDEFTFDISFQSLTIEIHLSFSAIQKFLNQERGEYSKMWFALAVHTADLALHRIYDEQLKFEICNSLLPDYLVTAIVEPRELSTLLAMTKLKEHTATFFMPQTKAFLDLYQFSPEVFLFPAYSSDSQKSNADNNISFGLVLLNIRSFEIWVFALQLSNEIPENFDLTNLAKVSVIKINF